MYADLLTRVVETDPSRIRVVHFLDLRIDLDFREMTREGTWIWRSLTWVQPTGHNGDADRSKTATIQIGDTQWSKRRHTLVKTTRNIGQNRQMSPYVWQGNGQNDDKPKRRHREIIIVYKRHVLMQK